VNARPTLNIDTTNNGRTWVSKKTEGVGVLNRLKKKAGCRRGRTLAGDVRKKKKIKSSKVRNWGFTAGESMKGRESRR